MLHQGLGIQFDLACRRSETSGDAVLLLSELAVACLERHPYPAGVLAQCHERNAGWMESRAVSGLDVTVPKWAPRPRRHARSKTIWVSERASPRGSTT